ncbi:MAG: monovalent cation/H(+) antiporter subunit G [Thermodesulfobacteriota bacterium]
MVNIIIVILMLLGLFFFFGTAVGVVHFPDFYSRMHAAGKGDTLSTALILTGLALYHLQDFNLDTLLVSGKIMSIVLYIFIASPTATHAIMDAGYESGIQHLSNLERKNKQKGETK